MSVRIEDYEEELYRKIKVLNEITWEYRANRPNINEWLSNFSDSKEKLHALFMLSQFMYFGNLQMRELLKCIYRDLYKYPKIEFIRKSLSNTFDMNLILAEFLIAETKTRFLGVGNPSESGTHLLYFFRQENRLRKDLFINIHEIFKTNENGGIELANSNINHYVFIDDFCGSGSQAIRNSKEVIKLINDLDPSIETSYLMLFATSDGKNTVKTKTLFTHVDTVVELDNSFKLFDIDSRYFKNISSHIERVFLQKMCEEHGRKLMTSIYQEEGKTDPTLTKWVERDKLGFRDSQLLIGFHHNTPNNTLPVLWYDEAMMKWFPIFRRYNKIYGL